MYIVLDFEDLCSLVLNWVIVYEVLDTPVKCCLQALYPLNMDLSVVASPSAFNIILLSQTLNLKSIKKSAYFLYPFLEHIGSVVPHFCENKNFQTVYF